MDIQAARKLALDLRRHGRMRLSVEVVPNDTKFTDWGMVREDKADQKVAVVDENGRARWQYVVGGRIVFKGGAKGEHSLDLLASSPERILAHWEGYCEANGMLKPVVGQVVSFPSGSHPSGVRMGRVLKVGSKRALVAFTYKHGGKGTKSVPFNELGIL
jgi:hypothetical protein